MERRIPRVVGAALLLLSACASPPDVGPFADATVALSAAVRASGETLDRSVRGSGLTDAKEHADRLKAAWARRIAVMDEAVAYADGLREIVAAADSSADTVQNVAGSLQSIVNAAGIAMPATGVVEVATDGAGLVYRQIANARAAKTIGESLAASDGAIQELATLLAADRKDVDELLRIVETRTVGAIQVLPKYKELPLQLDTAEAAAGAIAARIGQASEEDVARLRALTERADSLRLRLAERDAEIAAVRAERRAQSDLVSAYGEALSAWSAAHGQLVRAVREQRPVSAAALLEATEEMRVLIRKVRAL